MTPEEIKVFRQKVSAAIRTWGLPGGQDIRDPEVCQKIGATLFPHPRARHRIKDPHALGTPPT